MGLRPALAADVNYIAVDSKLTGGKCGGCIHLSYLRDPNSVLWFAISVKRPTIDVYSIVIIFRCMLNAGEPFFATARWYWFAAADGCSWHLSGKAATITLSHVQRRKELVGRNHFQKWDHEGNVTNYDDSPSLQATRCCTRSSNVHHRGCTRHNTWMCRVSTTFLNAPTLGNVTYFLMRA